MAHDEDHVPLRLLTKEGRERDVVQILTLLEFLFGASYMQSRINKTLKLTERSWTVEAENIPRDL